MSQPDINAARSMQLQIIIDLADAILAVDPTNPSSMVAFDALWGKIDAPIGRRQPALMTTPQGKTFTVPGGDPTPAPALVDAVKEFLSEHKTYPVPPHGDFPDVDHFDTFLKFLKDVIGERVAQTQDLLGSIDRIAAVRITPEPTWVQIDLMRSVAPLPRLMRAYTLLASWPGGGVPKDQDKGELDQLIAVTHLIPFAMRDQVEEALTKMLRKPNKIDNNDWELDELVRETQELIDAQKPPSGAGAKPGI